MGYHIGRVAWSSFPKLYYIPSLSVCVVRDLKFATAGIDLYSLLPKYSPDSERSVKTLKTSPLHPRRSRISYSTFGALVQNTHHLHQPKGTPTEECHPSSKSV